MGKCKRCGMWSCNCQTFDSLREVANKYEDNQCPECGCEEFGEQNNEIVFFQFIEGCFEVIKRKTEPISTECLKCDSKVNILESIKQGKIVLA